MQIAREFLIESAASADDYRPILQHVKITTYGDKPVAVAADGFLLAIVPVTLDEGDVPGLVPADHFKAARKATPRSIGRTVLLLDETTTRDLTGTARLRPTELLPEHFPDFSRVIPDPWLEAGAIEFGINPTMLARLAKALGAATLALRRGGRVDAPLLVKDTALLRGGNWTEPPFGVIMPVGLGRYQTTAEVIAAAEKSRIAAA